MKGGFGTRRLRTNSSAYKILLLLDRDRPWACYGQAKDHVIPIVSVKNDSPGRLPVRGTGKEVQGGCL